MKINLHKNKWTILVQDDIRTLSQNDFLKIAKLVSTNMVVVFENTAELTINDQLHAAGSIGTYHTMKDKERGKDLMVVDGIIRVTGKKNERGAPGLFGHTSALEWHADQASNKTRAPIVWMYGVEGMEGSRTSFINMIEVYQGLPKKLKNRIANKKCYFGYESGRYTTSKWFKEHIVQENLFELVMTTTAGVTGLYFPFNQVFGMENTSKEEFNELCEELKTHILKEQYAYHHDWKDNQIILSDQWLSIHKRWEFEKMEQRLLHRMAMDYDKVYDSYPY